MKINGVTDTVAVALKILEKEAKHKTVTKKLSNVNKIIELFRNLVDVCDFNEFDQEVVDIQLEYFTLDVAIKIKLPFFYNFNHEAVAICRQIIELTDEISHKGPAYDEEMMPVDDHTWLWVSDVFKV